MSVAVRVSLFAALAFLGGVGTVYAPVPTFTAVAVLFAVGLWKFAGGGSRPSLARFGTIKRLQSTPHSTRVTRFVSAYLLLFWVGLIIPLATYSPRPEAVATTTAATSLGSRLTLILVPTFGLLGACFLPAAIRRFDKAFQWPAVLWALYLGWAATSLLWTAVPTLTFRNVVAFVLVSVGCFGLGAGFYGNLPNGRDLFLRHLFWASVLSALVILLPLPFRFQEYDLLNPSSRLAIGGNFSAYVTRPIMISMLAIAATIIMGVRRWRRTDLFWVVLLILPLLALKSRGPILWGIVALFIFYLFFRTSVRDRMLQAGALLVAGLGTYIYYSENVLQTIIGPLVPFLTRGNVQATENLSGRVPLWQTLIEQVGQDPWVGVGFAAFWSPQNLGRLGLSGVLAAPSAHNGFLEELLNTGVVGLVILLAFCLTTLTMALRRGRRGDPLGWLVFLFMVFYLLLNLTNALTQEYFQPPFVAILLALSLLATGPPSPQPYVADTIDRGGELLLARGSRR